MAKKGLELAHKHFTCMFHKDFLMHFCNLNTLGEAKFERLVESTLLYREGKRGYYFPFGFELGCHRYGWDEEHRKVVGAWCDNNSTTY